MKTRIKLSDKILIIAFLFSSALLLLIKFVGGISYLRLLAFGYFLYNTAFIITFLINKNFVKRLEKLTYKIE